ncbi:MAG: glycosyltransferase family 4 protein [Alphaproteobacteria bacterium]
MSLVYPIQALVISLILIELLRHAAKDLNLLDRPNYRKLHAGEVPLIGGLGIFGAVVLSAAVVPGLGAKYGFLFFPALFLLLLGLLDDARDLKPKVKLASQVCVSILVLVLEPQLLLKLADGDTMPVFWKVLSWVLTVTVLTGAMNAFNMMDGVDGLAGAISSIALCWIMIAAAVSGFHFLDVMALQVLMPVIAFLHFNARAPWRRRAVVFLGDAGSLMLGFCITVFGLQLAGPSKGGWSALALCFIIALPVVDTLSLIARRLMAGRSPLSADRQHLHHLLQQAGCSPGQVTALLTWVSVAIGGLGLFLDLLRVGSLALLGVLVGLFCAHLVLVSYLQWRIQTTASPASLAGPAPDEGAQPELALARSANPGGAQS